MTIWKYQLEVLDSQQIKMPIGARVLCVQTQGGLPCLWALVNPVNTLAPREFRIFGTGHDAGRSHYSGYVGTFQLHGGGLVFHVFEVPS